MTEGEKAVWRAVYAVAWFQPTGRVEPGVVTDDERATFAGMQAFRAVMAFRALASESDAVAEALR